MSGRHGTRYASFFRMMLKETSVDRMAAHFAVIDSCPDMHRQFVAWIEHCFGVPYTGDRTNLDFAVTRTWLETIAAQQRKAN